MSRKLSRVVPFVQCLYSIKSQMNGSSRSKKDPCSLLDGAALWVYIGGFKLIDRNKEPYFGLYMLNRATVKNPLWPLIPNEIRVTPTVDDMLIVERKGEGEFWI